MPTPTAATMPKDVMDTSVGINLNTGATSDVADDQRSRDPIKQFAHFLETSRGHAVLLSLIMIDFVIVIIEICVSLVFACEHNPVVSTIEDVLHWTTIALLSMFTAEVILKLYAFGVRYFYKPFHLIDASVIIASLVLSIVLKGVGGELAGLIVLLRVWRIVRLVDSVVLATELRHEEKLEHTHKEMGSLRARVAELERQLARTADTPAR